MKENSHPNLLYHGYSSGLSSEKSIFRSHEPYRYLNKCYPELKDFGKERDYDRYCPKEEETIFLCYKMYNQSGFVKDKNLSQEDLNQIGYYKIVPPTITPHHFVTKLPNTKTKLIYYRICCLFFLGGVELYCTKLDILHTSTVQAVNYRDCLLDLLPQYINAAPKDRDPTIFCKKLYKNKSVTRYVVDKRLKNIIATEYFLQRKDCDTSCMKPSHNLQYINKLKQEYILLNEFKADIILDEGEYILCPIPYTNIDHCKALLEYVASNEFHLFIKFSYELYPIGGKFKEYKPYLVEDYPDSEISERDLDILEKELMEEMGQDCFQRNQLTFREDKEKSLEKDLFIQKEESKNHEEKDESSN